MTTRALVLIGLCAIAACKRQTTGVPACDHHLEARRACAKQLGGELGDSIAREADRLEQHWLDTAKQGIKDWKTKYAPKWCTAATDDARTAFPECSW